MNIHKSYTKHIYSFYVIMPFHYSVMICRQTLDWILFWMWIGLKSEMHKCQNSVDGAIINTHIIKKLSPYW